ncbi:MAG: hypothetical protein J6O51_05240 [Bacteroidales bacterium]|nr:hypothetical protein [Bacteroidales bacterium]
MATTKKTKKIVTPIDERETFVSLQKNFADTESNTEEKLKILYDLQNADNAIEKLIQLRGELPSEVADLEAQVASCKDKIAEQDKVIAQYNENIAAMNEDIVSLDGEMEKYRKQLENISNSREFDSINKELENLGILRKIDEKKIGESREAIADSKAAIQRINDKLDVLNIDLEAKQEELAKIVESTSKEEKVLVKKREELAEKLDERTLSAYDRIRASVHNHLAVVTVFNGDSCGGCFNTVTPQRLIDIASGKKLVICEHCGRIIVATPETAE